MEPPIYTLLIMYIIRVVLVVMIRMMMMMTMMMMMMIIVFIFFFYILLLLLLLIIFINPSVSVFIVHAQHKYSNDSDGQHFWLSRAQLAFRAAVDALPKAGDKNKGNSWPRKG